ncbi:MAG: hypothetical protein L0216_03545 [Planctomycetales bacterium]|nr:hypothetical protein [Planctomycetales bacterium]
MATTTAADPKATATAREALQAVRKAIEAARGPVAACGISRSYIEGWTDAILTRVMEAEKEIVKASR